jgi:hypothetical protein
MWSTDFYKIKIINLSEMSLRVCDMRRFVRARNQISQLDQQAAHKWPRFVSFRCLIVYIAYEHVLRHIYNKFTPIFEHFSQQNTSVLKSILDRRWLAVLPAGSPAAAANFHVSGRYRTPRCSI